MYTDRALQVIAQKNVKRMGILGGTFDPIHSAHVALAYAAKSEFKLDSILLLTAGEPPHKHSVAGKEHRYAMAEKAAMQDTFIHATRMEIDREGMTYTVDSLRTIRSVLGNEVELFYIVGEDTLADVHNWKEYESVMQLTNLIVFFRKGHDVELKESKVDKLMQAYQNRILFGKASLPELSSSSVRKRVTQGLPLEGMLPYSVEAYIKEHDLYTDCALSFDEASSKLTAELNPKRFHHTLGVIKSAKELAQIWDVDLHAASWAALLHDCAKNIPPKNAIAQCAAWGIELDAIMLQATQLIHGPLGAEIARREYEIEDEAILDAICFHSTGKPRMSALSKIVFLADLIEPGRSFTGVEELRTLARINLDRALRVSMDQIIAFILQRGELLHPLTVLARNELLGK